MDELHDLQRKVWLKLMLAKNELNERQAFVEKIPK
jgi:hypothetical protein